jgi:hypothetical protein
VHKPLSAQKLRALLNLTLQSARGAD